MENSLLSIIDLYANHVPSNLGSYTTPSFANATSVDFTAIWTRPQGLVNQSTVHLTNLNSIKNWKSVNLVPMGQKSILKTHLNALTPIFREFALRKSLITI